MPVLHHTLLDEKARSREGTASLDPLRGKWGKPLGGKLPVNTSLLGIAFVLLRFRFLS